MHRGQTVFAQLFEFVSHYEFQRCVDRYNGNRCVRRLPCWEQFLAMAFAQFTSRHGLRDIEVSLAAQGSKLYHSGFRHRLKRSTLAEANQQRDWRIYCDFAHSLICEARTLYAEQDLGIGLDATLYALDSTTIDLCLNLFPWAHFRRAKGAVKLHTMIDLRGSIPVFVDVTHGKVHDLRALDKLVFEPGTYVVMDRAYVGLKPLYRMQQAACFFIVRSRQRIQCRRRYSHVIDKHLGVRSDQTIILTGHKSSLLYPAPLRRVSYYAADIDRRFVFLTNNFTLSAHTVAAMYRSRWQIELFFKWIKQHLRIKRFYGTSPNAVKTQIWIALSVYVLVAIIKRKLQLPHTPYTILQILSLTLFEKIPILSLFERYADTTQLHDVTNQLDLFTI